MPFYTVGFEKGASGIDTANKTMLYLAVPDVVGDFAKIIGVNIGPSDATPPDKNMVIQLRRIPDVSALSVSPVGTAVTPTKRNSISASARFTAKRILTTEPTADYDADSLWPHGLNAHGSIAYVWNEGEEPIANADQALGLLIASADGVALNLTGSLTIFAP